MNFNRKKTVTRILIFITVVAGVGWAAAGRSDDFRPGMGPFMPALDRLDENGDGILTVEEFAANRTDHSVMLFYVLDQDGDGFISAEEYELPPFKGFRGPRGRFEPDPAVFEQCMMDKLGAAFKGKPTWEDLVLFDSTEDQDGLIDLDEFLAYHENRFTERFEDIDLNGDNMLDEGEMDAFAEQIQKHRAAFGDCMMEQRGSRPRTEQQ